jgi:type IV pilus assembly protein PilM
VSDSLWKKELSFRRKPKEPVEPPPVAPEPEPLEAVVQSAPAPEPIPEPALSTPPVSQQPAGDYGWLTHDFDPNQVPENMPAIAPPPVSLPAPPLPEEAGPVPLPAVTVQDLPKPSPEPAPEPDLAPAAAAASGPFWKKELSFSRKPKAAKQPKAEKAPKEKKQKAPKKPKEPKAEKPKSEKTPFWKLELSKKPKEPKAEKPKSEKTPFWKLELSKKPKGPKEPKAETPKAEKTPFWKLELTKKPKQPKAGKAPRAKKDKAGGTVVGLKIGASQVAAARVANGAAPQLLQVARAPLAEGIVVAGELRDVDALAETLKELFAKNKLPKRGVRLGIANNRIGVRTFEVAGIDDNRQLANAIRFRAQEQLPIPLEEAVLDWQILSERYDEEAGVLMKRVLLVVVHRELVDQYVSACKKAGIRLSGIDLEAFAMLRALGAPLAPDAPDPTGVTVLVNVGHDRSTFAVSDGRHCEFTRVLGWGGENLTAAIAQALDVTPEEATPIKHAVSLVANAAPMPEGVDPASVEAACEPARAELQNFARELVSSLRFYQNQPGALAFGEVILTGGTAHLPGFAEELHRLIGVPVRVADPLNRVVVPKKFREPGDYSLGSLTVAIGLGIED